MSRPITAGGTRRKSTFSPLRLDANRVDVWHCFPDALGRGQVSACLSTLSRVELSRYRRMRSAEGRLHFLVGRSLARNTLSRYADIPVRSWRFSINEYGRPAVDWPRACRNIHFSVSHTSGLVAVAVSPISEIGIDVERVDRQVDISGIAEAVFTQCEMERILRCAPDENRDRFFGLWTLKEAYIKARGRGFSLPPRTFEFASLDDPISLRCPPDCDPTPERWQFHLSRRRPGLRIAIAVGSRSITRIRQLEWKPLRREVLIESS